MTSRSNKEVLLYELFPYEAINSNPKDVNAALDTFPNIERLPVMVDPYAYVGIEVEVENLGGIRFPHDQPFWGHTEDGSLRNAGMEFVSKPIRGQAIPAALSWLNTFLNTSHKQHSFSGRTSVHVHQNVRDLTVEQLYTLCLLYLVFEPMLFKVVFDLCKVNRESNIFCVPVSDGMRDLDVSHFLSSLNPGGAQQVKLLNRTWRKYSAFNLVPVTTFGTVEWRHMGGTINVESLCQWINIIQSLKVAAQSGTWDDYKAEILELNTNSRYTQFMFKVFGVLGGQLTQYNIREDLERGVISVKKALAGGAESYITSYMQLPFPEAEKSFLDNSSLRNYLERVGCRFIYKSPEEREKEAKEMIASLSKELLELQARDVEVRGLLTRKRNERARAEERLLSRRGLSAEQRQELDNLVVRLRQEETNLVVQADEIMFSSDKIRNKITYYTNLNKPQSTTKARWTGEFRTTSQILDFGDLRTATERPIDFFTPDQDEVERTWVTVDDTGRVVQEEVPPPILRARRRT